jgi:DNA-binding NarL/FixJ family response regulator
MAIQDEGLIRPARLSDAQAITGLLAQLGYPDEIANVSARLQRMDAREDIGVLVAEIGGQVTAVAAYQLMDLLERRQPQCRITSLVVRADARRMGLARGLLERIEAVGTERGCFRLEVTTQAHREDAACLYLALGFQERPRRFVKPLQLVAGIRVIAEGESLLAPTVTRRLIEPFLRERTPAPEPPPALAELTHRELEVLGLIARGLSNSEIAHELVVSDATVKTHVARVLSKLGLRDRVQAVVLAYETGIARPRSTHARES